MAKYIVNGLEHGFKLRYSGPRIPIESNSKPLLGEKAKIAREKILKEISLGRIAGPFKEPPFPTFRTSPIAVIPKKASNEFRLIHNLSSPPDKSVNDHICKDDSAVQYSSIDDAVRIIQGLGYNALLAKCDIKSAFRLIRLSPSEFDLTGFKFEDEYYFDKNLCMGASSSCSIWESFAKALHWYVENKSGNKNILHYIDDFLFGGAEGTKQCQNTLDMFMECCKDWGVPLAHDKTCQPTTKLIFLGIFFDTSHYYFS